MSELWQTEMVEIMRGLLFDLDDDNPTYSESQLLRLIVVAAGFVVREVDFPTTYTINITRSSISPDPSAEDTKDPDLMNLTCLKAACMVDMGASRIAVAQGIIIRDDKVTADFTAKALNSLMLLKQGYCKVYEDAITEYRNDTSSSLAAAVLSPFRSSTRGYLTTLLDFSKA